MRAIETTAVVTPDHTITVQLPEDIPPGECRVVVVVEPGQAVNTAGSFTANWPVHDVGPWPKGFTVRREEIYGDDGR